MEKKGFSLAGGSIVVLVLTFFLFTGNGYAQIEGLEGIEELGRDTVQCKPDSFVTSYETYESDSLSAQQLGIWYSLAREEYKYENYERAIPYYWKVLVNDRGGKFRVVYSKLADCYFRLNQPDSVFIVVYRGLQLHPDYTRLHYWAGYLHDRLGHYGCAIPHYEALVNENPKEKSYWVKLAFLYYEENDPKAIQAQQKVVELAPKDVEASKLMAEIMEHFGEDPLQARKQTYLKDTTNVENAMRYARSAFERGLNKEAIEPFKAVVAQEPKNTTALEYIGRCYEGLNQLSTALQYYRKILQIEPKNVNVMCLMASVYGRLHQFKTASNYIYKAQQADPGNGLPHMVMAEIYESAVTYCSDKRAERSFNYEDKVVYRLAQDELRKAAQDPNYSSVAKNRVNQLDPLTPTKEDLFLHDNRLEPRGKCYAWINE